MSSISERDRPSSSGSVSAAGAGARAGVSARSSRLQEAFNTVDKSGDGQIDWGELSAAIKAMDPKASDKVGRALPARARARRAACGPPSSRRARTRGCPRSLRT